MSEPAVLCSGLDKTFASPVEELRVLRGLDLRIEPGSTVAIMGASGSGKSTLLSLIGGLDRASGGEIRVGSWDLRELPERRLSEFRSSTVGFVFQFHYLLKDFTALENVALPAFIRGEPKRAAYARAATLLEEMGLSDRLGHVPAKLSGGERQRAAIARALINNPRLLLADEPTGNLDAANALSVRKLLFGLAERHGTTVIVATHDPALAAEADLRYTLAEGQARLQ